jgi:hypothetical protein
MIVAFVSNVELSYIPDNPFKSKILEYHVSSTLESKQETEICREYLHCEK